MTVPFAWAALAVLAGLSACHVDPCAGKGPVCVGVYVRGQSPPLDRFDVTAELASGATLRATVSAGAFSLPAQFALLLPSTTAGRVNVSVIGFAGGTPLGRGGSSLTVPPSGQRLDVTLGAGGPPPVLVAAHPALARAGTSVVLEGSFPPGSVAHFPFGDAPLVSLGPGRAQVVVPAGPGRGALTVTAPGGSQGVLFEQPPWVPALDTFRAEYDQADYGRQTPALETPREGAVAAILGRMLYVAGGRSAAGAPLAQVESARIEGDDTLGPLRLLPLGLMAARSDAAAVVLGGSLYVLGGADQAGALASVEVGTVASDGGLTFTDAGIALDRARAAPAAEWVGTFLYVVGGSSGAQDLATVARAPLDADGRLGPFVPVAAALVTPRSGAAALVSGGWFYVLGGRSGTQVLDTIERAPISADGSLGAFTAAGRLDAPRDRPSVVASSESIWVLGGATAPVALAQVQPDGTLGAFGALGVALTAPRPGAVVVRVGERIYALGGRVASTVVGTLESAALDAVAQLGTFAVAPASRLGNARRSPAVAITADRVHVIAGFDGVNHLGSVEDALLAPDGTLGGFQLANVSFPARRGGAAAVVGSSLYVFGGFDGTNALGDVLRAVIGPDGTLGPFSAAGSFGLVVPRYSAGAVVIGGAVHLIGGHDQSGAVLASVERAAIAADGSLAAPALASSALVTARSNFIVARLGGYVYVLGGNAGAPGWLASIERAPVAADGTLGAFAPAAITLNQPRAAPGAVVVGGSLYLFGGFGNPSVLASVEKSPILPDGTLMGFQPLAGISLAMPTAYVRAVRAGFFVHMFGGEGTAPTAAVERAPIQ